MRSRHGKNRQKKQIVKEFVNNHYSEVWSRAIQSFRQASMLEILEKRVLFSTIADWTFETSQPGTTAGTNESSITNISPEVGSGTASGMHASSSTTFSSPVGNDSNHSFNSGNWTTGDYYQFQVSTSGLTNIGLQFDQTSSATGPGNFTLEYSTNGSTFTPIPGSIYNTNTTLSGTGGNYSVGNATWAGNTTTTTSTYIPDLSGIQGTIDNQATVYFRLVDASSTAPGGGAVSGNGTDRLDNVIITSGPPTIGSLTVTPSSVTVNTGGNVTLTAGNITDSSGNVTEVDFYENGFTDQIGNATTNTGGNWTFTVSTTGLFSGNATFYAVAKDSNGIRSFPATTTLQTPGTVIAGWTFESSAPVTAGNATLYAPETGTQTSNSLATAFHGNASAVYSSPAGDGSTHSYSSNVWSVNDYYQFKTDTAGEANIELSWDQTSSSTGPANYQLQYSTDGVNFSPVTATITLGNGTTSTTGNYSVPLNSGTTTWGATGAPVAAAVFSVNLSSITAVNNKSAVYFRMVNINNTAENGSSPYASGGTDRIDNVGISGTPVLVPTIGSLTVNPSSIVVGNTTQVTLTANNVLPTNSATGNVTGVEFYEMTSSGNQDLGPGNLTSGTTNNGGNWTFSVPTTGNYSTSTLPTGNTTFLAIATDNTGNTSASASVPLTVVGQQQVKFDVTSYSINENTGNLTIQVDRQAASGYSLAANTTVDFTTSDGSHFAGNNTQVDGAAVAGTDYVANSGNITFTGNATTANFTVQILPVTTFTGNRTFNLTLSQDPGSPTTSITAPTTIPVTIADTAPADSSTPSGNATAVYNVEQSTVTGPNNGFSVLAYENHNSYNYASFPDLEFGGNSTVFSGNSTVGKVDSVKLSLYNTATSGGYAGVPGTFAVYLLTNNSVSATTLNYAASGDTGTSVLADDHSAFVDGFSSADEVGTATFTNNVVGYNDFTFDNLTPTVSAALTNYLHNGGTNPIRFVAIPLTGMSADWAGNTASNEQPKLTLLTEPGTPEFFSVNQQTDTIDKGNSDTITINRTGNLTGNVTVPYTLTGTAVNQTDYTLTGPNGTSGTTGNFTFASGQGNATVTVNALSTPVSGDSNFTLTLGTPPPSGNFTYYAASPYSEVVTIHDNYTTDTQSASADDLATVFKTGVSGNATAENTFNVEADNATNGNFTSFGVLEYGNGLGQSIGLNNSEIGTINQLTINATNDPGSFAAAGTVNVYVTADSSTSIDYGSPLTFETSADPTGIAGTNQFSSPLYLLGTIQFNPSQPVGQFAALPVTLSSQSAAGLGVLANEINTGGTYRIVLAPGDSNVSLRWEGEVTNASDVSEAPYLSFNYTPISDWETPGVSAGVWQWNAQTQTFTVTGSTTIFADPATYGVDPNIVGSGNASQLLIQPTVEPTDIHVGGIDLTNGASVVMASMNDESNDHADNHNVLVVGTDDQASAPTFIVDNAQTITSGSWTGNTVTIQAPGTYTQGELVNISGVMPDGFDGTFAITGTVSGGFTYSSPAVSNNGPSGNATLGTSPTATTDSGSKLDLEDNDLIVHGGNDGSNDMAAVQAAAALGRNVPSGGTFDGTWDGNGLTSSVAGSVDSNNNAGYEQNILAVELNSDRFLGALPSWTVGNGTVSEALRADGNDVLVKYTYLGDLNLSGAVDGNAATIFESYYQSGSGTGGTSPSLLSQGLNDDYAYGDLNGAGYVDDTDATIFESVFNNGEPGSGLPTL
jgi:hypothetical protein